MMNHNFATRFVQLSVAIVVSVGMVTSCVSTGFPPSSQLQNLTKPEVGQVLDYQTQCMKASPDDWYNGHMAMNPTLITTEIVKDSVGSYVRTGLKNWNGILVNDEPISSLPSKPRSAAEFAIKFVVEEALDSIALDDEKGFTAWKKNVAPKYIEKSSLKKILKGPFSDDYSGSSFPMGRGIILTDVKNNMPTLLRDGGSRAAFKKFVYIHIQDMMQPTTTYRLEFNGLVYYFVSDERFKERYKDLDPNGWYKDVFKDKPSLNDGKAQYVPVDFLLTYLVKQVGSGWKITYDADYGSVNSFNMQDSWATNPDAFCWVPASRVNQK